MLWVHIGIASMSQFQYVPTTYVTEIKVTDCEIYIYQEPCPLAELLESSQSAYQY